jgi:hypothetical protein
MICIYEKSGAQNIVHIVSSIEKAAVWLNCSARVLYRNLKIDGAMHYGAYFVERL